MSKRHTNRTYANELLQLRDRIILLSGRVENMIAYSIKALSESDISLAKKIIEFDLRIDKEEMAIDQLCIEMLARRQPLAQDLRFIVSVLKMVTYIERIGDLAVKICERVIKLKKLHHELDISGLKEMACGVQEMIKDTLESFMTKDLAIAQHVIAQDDQIDELYHTSVRHYIAEMREASTNVESYFHLMSIAKWLERTGDHCTNLAEIIIYMVDGKDVRHQKNDENELALA